MHKQLGTVLSAAGALAAVMGLPTPGTAADVPYRTAPALPAPAVSAPSWSGLYLGGHVGYGWGDFDFRDPTVTLSIPGLAFPGGGLSLGLPLERNFHGDSFLAGGQIGANAQWGNVVVGVEADLSWTDINGAVRSTGGPFTILGFGPITTAEGASANVDWLGTGRGRLGLAFGNFLFYGTGGVAFGRVAGAGDVTATLGPNSISLRASDHQTHVGWTAGGGIEAMLAPTISAKVEYLFADLGWEKHQAPGLVSATPLVAAFIPPGTSVRASGDFKVEVQTIKAGLNYRFTLW